MRSMDQQSQHRQDYMDVLRMTPPHLSPGIPDTPPSSSSALKRSVSERILDEFRGGFCDSEEDFVATHLLEQTKKLKITTVPGIATLFFEFTLNTPNVF